MRRGTIRRIGKGGAFLLEVSVWGMAVKTILDNLRVVL